MDATALYLGDWVMSIIIAVLWVKCAKITINETFCTHL